MTNISDKFILLIKICINIPSDKDIGHYNINNGFEILYKKN